jgi:hypothetical protein
VVLAQTNQRPGRFSGPQWVEDAERLPESQGRNAVRSALETFVIIISNLHFDLGQMRLGLVGGARREIAQREADQKIIPFLARPPMNGVKITTRRPQQFLAAL